MEKRDLKKRKEIVKNNRKRFFDYWAKKCNCDNASCPEYKEGEWAGIGRERYREINFKI